MVPLGLLDRLRNFFHTSTAPHAALTGHLCTVIASQLFGSTYVCHRREEGVYHEGLSAAHVAHVAIEKTRIP